MTAASRALTPTAEFQNVDLVIRSRFSLAPLLEVWPWAQAPDRRMGKPVRWLIVSPRANPKNCESAVTSLIDLVEALSPQARQCWNKAYSKTFDVGVQAGLGPSVFEEIQMTTKSLHAIAAAGGRVQVTVYAPAVE